MREPPALNGRVLFPKRLPDTSGRFYLTILIVQAKNHDPKGSKRSKVMRRKYLFIVIASLVGVLMMTGFIHLIAKGMPASAKSDASDQALIAIQFTPSEQIVREISFTAPISGLAALRMTGIPSETVDYGGGFIAVCSINGVGCPATDCFCDPSKFWSYEYWDGSAWQGYSVGAADSSIGDGAIEGWRWTDFGVGSLPPEPQLQAAQDALDWLALQQSPTNGGYGTAGASAESMLSIGANGESGLEWRFTPSSPSLMGYMLGKAVDYSDAGDTAGKLAAGLVGASGCWPYGAAQPLDYFDPLTGEFSGQYGQGAGPQAWGMLGTASLSQTIPPTATAYLTELQQIDGGWEWVPGGFGGGTDTNATALAIQALIAAGIPPSSQVFTDGLDYLKAAQNTDGGFPYDPDSPYGTASDTNSTAYIILAIRAAGRDPSTWMINSTNPITYLLGMQLLDGSFEFQPGTGANLFSTQQAIPALLGRVLPLSESVPDSCPAFFLPIITRIDAP